MRGALSGCRWLTGGRECAVRVGEAEALGDGGGFAMRSNIIIAVLAAATATVTGCSSSTLHGTTGIKGVTQPGTGQPPSSSSQHIRLPSPHRHRRTVAAASGTAGSASPPARRSHPVRAIRKTLATYFSGINDGNYWSAYDTFSPAVRARISESSFAAGDSTSHDSHEHVVPACTGR